VHLPDFEIGSRNVSVGAISGIGLFTGRADKRMLSGIFMYWVLTLPIAAITGGIVYKVLP